MNMDCFFKRFCQILMNDDNDHIFSEIKVLTSGTTSPRIAKLLNFAVSQMDKGECYLEVGVFTGATLCSAAYMTGKPCVGIDNFDPDMIKDMTNMSPSSLHSRCMYNIQNLAPSAKLINKDFRNVTKEEIGQPIAVSFIDGKHTYKDVKENVEWLEPLLADNAILIFDDINYYDVQDAILELVKTRSENYETVFYAKPFLRDDAYTWSITERFLNNGVCILRYHKDPTYKCVGIDPRKSK